MTTPKNIAELDEMRAAVIAQQMCEPMHMPAFRRVAAAIREADERAGLAVVPVEPTAAMADAIDGGVMDWGQYAYDPDAYEKRVGSLAPPKPILTAMIAASPYRSGN